MHLFSSNVTNVDTFAAVMEFTFDKFKLKKNNNKKTFSLSFQKRNLVVINVSPLEYGHILLVPDIEACRPQVQYCRSSFG